MPEHDDPRFDNPDKRPLDELFVVGAKYHEPTAAERAAAAKRAEKEHKQREAARQKEIAKTRKLLGADRSDHDGPFSNPYDRNRTALAFAGLVAVAIALSFTSFVS